jgi:hypothetical protein
MISTLPELFARRSRCLDVSSRPHRDPKEAFATSVMEMTLPRGLVRYYLE